MIEKDLIKLIVLIFGKSGSGKTTFIKSLINKKFREAFDVLDGRINTTPVMMDYILSNCINDVIIEVVLKDRESFVGLSVKNLVAALTKYMKQQIVGGIKNLTEEDHEKYIRSELNKVIFKDNIGSFSIHKILENNEQLKVEYMEVTVHVIKSLNAVVNTFPIESGNKVNELLLQEVIEDKINISIEDDIEVDNEVISIKNLFNKFYESGIDLLKKSGYENSDDLIYKGIYYTVDELKKGLTAINNANKTPALKKLESAISLVSEITITVPSEVSFGEYNYALFKDAYGLSQDGSDKIEESMYKLMSSVVANAAILIQKFNENKEDMNKIVKIIDKCSPSLKLIPVISQVDYISNDHDEIYEEIQVVQDETIDRLNDTIADKVKVRIPLQANEIYYYGTKNIEGCPKIDDVTKNIINDIVNDAQKREKNYNIDFKNVKNNKLLCLEGIISSIHIIQINIKESIVNEFNQYAFEYHNYHGNTINNVLYYLSCGYGYCSNCNVYRDINTRPYWNIKNIFMKELGNIEINNNLYIEKDIEKLLDMCKEVFATEIFKSIQKYFVYNNKDKFNKLWYYNKLGKLRGVAEIIEHTINQTNDMESLVQEALENTSIDVVKKFVNKY